MKSKLISTDDEMNALLNITSKSNPEASYLGDRDSVATTYGITGGAKGFFETSKVFFSFILNGTSGKIILSVFSGMFGLLALYFITKWIRNGM